MNRISLTDLAKNKPLARKFISAPLDRGTLRSWQASFWQLMTCLMDAGSGRSVLNANSSALVR